MTSAARAAPPPERQAPQAQTVDAGGVRWHLQRWPAADAAARDAGPWLLLHGTGASAHSWAALAPLLATQGEVLAVDLPGHARSGPLPPGRPVLPGMAAATAALLQALQTRPRAVLGHSAGAAVMVRMALDGHFGDSVGSVSAGPPANASRLPLLVGLNAALQPFDGLAGVLLPPLARLLSLSPLVPSLLAWRAQNGRLVRRLIDATGSRLDEAAVAGYAELVRNPRHVAGALAMTADWDLHALQRDLLSAPPDALALHLLVGAADRTVPPQQAEHLAQRRAGVSVHRLHGLGHLAHEEAPHAVAQALQPLLRSAARSR